MLGGKARLYVSKQKSQVLHLEFGCHVLYNSSGTRIDWCIVVDVRSFLLRGSIWVFIFSATKQLLPSEVICLLVLALIFLFFFVFLRSVSTFFLSIFVLMFELVVSITVICKGTC